MVVEAVATVARAGYNRVVRPVTPRVEGELNGVTVYGPFRLFDRRKSAPEAEAALVAACKATVDPDDTVCVVGCGWGISTVWDARLAGDAGCVYAFDGSEQSVERTRETIRRNGVAGRVTVTHAIVGPPIQVYPGRDGAGHYTPAELPACDVLELDCEGAEVAILEDLEQRPRALIVEYHPDLGAPRSAVESAVPDEYRVVDHYDHPTKDETVLVFGR